MVVRKRDSPKVIKENGLLYNYRWDGSEARRLQGLRQVRVLHVSQRPQVLYILVHLHHSYLVTVFARLLIAPILL